MSDTVEIEVGDIQTWADRAGLSVSDYLREAARQKAQREDLANE